MLDHKVYETLSKLKHSKYYNIRPETIAECVGYNNSIKYLSELILVNDKEKSDLHEVSESSSKNYSWSRSLEA